MSTCALRSRRFFECGNAHIEEYVKCRIDESEAKQAQADATLQSELNTVRQNVNATEPCRGPCQDSLRDKLLVNEQFQSRLSKAIGKDTFTAKQIGEQICGPANPKCESLKSVVDFAIQTHFNATVPRQVKALSDKIDALTIAVGKKADATTVRQLAATVTATTSSINELKNKTQADRTVVQSLQAGLNTTGTALSELTSKVESEKAKLATEKTRIDALTTLVDNEKTKLATETTRTNALTTTVDNEKIRTTNNKSLIDALTTTVDNEKTKLATETTRIDALTTTVDNEKIRTTNNTTEIRNLSTKKADKTMTNALQNHVRHNDALLKQVAHRVDYQPTIGQSVRPTSCAIGYHGHERMVCTVGAAHVEHRPARIHEQMTCPNGTVFHHGERNGNVYRVGCTQIKHHRGNLESQVRIATPM